MTITVNQETITPELAAEFLKKNKSNRPLSSKHVIALAGSIERGEWMFTGESIKFSESDTLLDGQHRLSAIVMAGSAVDMLVVKGLPDEAFHTIDIGSKKRGLSDVLAIAGEKNYIVLSAALAVIKAWEVNQEQIISYGQFSAQQIEEVLSRHPEVRTHASIRDGVKSMMHPSLACALSYLFSLVDSVKTDMFFDRLQHGVGLEKGSPILLLRDRLFLNKASKSKLPKKEIAALIIKSFNAFEQGKTMGTLRWGDNEKFPLIAGLNKFKVAK